MTTHSSAPYEFDDFENSRIATVATRTNLWGVISIIFGVLIFLGCAAAGAWSGEELARALKIDAPVGALFIVIGVVFGGIQIATGALYVGAAGAMRKVVETTGEDIPNAIRAVRQLGTVFYIQLALMAVGFVAGLAIAAFFVANLAK